MPATVRAATGSAICIVRSRVPMQRTVSRTAPVTSAFAMSVTIVPQIDEIS
jgi:hypothetical protein